MQMILAKRANFKTVKSLISPRTCHFVGVRSLVALVCAVFLSVMPATAQAQNSPSDDFVLKITTTAGTSATDTDFTFYTQDTNYDIDWDNDGAFEATGVSGDQSHTFNTAGVHTIRFRNLNDVHINNQAGKEKYTSIERWGTSVWNADMMSAFWGASNLTMTATDTPNISAVTNMRNMFLRATAFNGDISSWNTAVVMNMRSMFNGATSFDQNIGNWNTASVTTMRFMFAGASSFNQNIGNWNTASVEDMTAMFQNATPFNGDISGWNTASVTNMSSMFRGVTSFDQNIGNWNTASVTNMSSMFRGVTSFDQNIGNWNTASVTNMSSMFRGVTSFDQNIGNWNTASVEDMRSMFRGVTSFDQNIGNWNTASVTNMSSMFRGATSFNQSIGGWNVEAVTTMTDMFHSVPLSTANYDALLVGWDAQNLTSGVVFHGGNSLYMSVAAQTARANMISSTGHDWTITDGGLGTMNQAPTNILLSSTRIAENAGADAVVGMLSNTDMGGTYVYSLVDGQGDTNNGLFNISGTSLRLTASADYEKVLRRISFFLPPISTYSVRINVNDGTTNYEKQFTITVTNVENEPPTFSSGAIATIAVAENQTAVTTVVATVDAGQTVTFSLTGGADASKFTITPAGVLTFNMAPDFATPTDVGMDNTYEVTITAAGDGTPVMTATQALTITVTEAVEYFFSASQRTFTPLTGATAVTSVADDDELSVSLPVGFDFTFYGTTYSTLKASSNGVLTFNPAHTDPNIYDNEIAGTSVTHAIMPFWDDLDGSGAQASYKVTGSSPNRVYTFEWLNFESVNDNGEISCQVSLHETSNEIELVYGPGVAGFDASIGIKGVATDFFSLAGSGTSPMRSSGGTDDISTSPANGQVYQFSLTPPPSETNVAPVITSNGGGATATVSVAENQTAVTTVDATDADSGQTVTLTLSGDDAALFSLSSSGELTFNTAPDFEMPTDVGTNNMYEVTVTATDNGTPAMTATQALTITVTDVNEVVADPADDFVLEVTTTEGSNANDKSFTFYSQDMDYMVDWGEGDGFEQVTTGDAPHTFSTAGVHTIRLRSLNDVYINSDPFSTTKADATKYTSIEQWGTSVWNADMSNAFQGASNLTMNSNAGTPDMSAVTNMRSMFAGATSFNGDIGNWNTAAVTDMSSMFSASFGETSAFNGDIGNWNTAAVTDMSNMFLNAVDFNQNIGSWNTAKVENMSGMFGAFGETTVFNQDIGNWNTVAVTDMSGMFSGAGSFNRDIGNWNTTAVTDMQYMFFDAETFNQDIGHWNTAKVENMSGMFGAFGETTAFNQDIGNWNTVAVTDMSGMFQGTTAFNQDIGNWNTGAVTSMAFMFNVATSFNRDIGSWNTAAVTDMGLMFSNTTAFDQDIGRWNTEKVTDMSGMFNGAVVFDRNIGRWNVATLTDATDMFNNVTLSVANYDALLTGWDGQSLQSNVIFHGGNSLYSTVATIARENMISSDSWTITDGGLSTTNQAPTNIFLSSMSIAENAGANAVVGMLSNTDMGGTYTYTLTAGDGDTDNGSFVIDGTALQLIVSADFETKSSYLVRIQVSDGMGRTYQKPFTITVLNVETLAITGGSTATVPENRTAVITLTATVEVAGRTATFLTTLGGADASQFSITSAGVLTFKTAPDYEVPTDTGADNVYEVTITATDNGTPEMTATQALTITVTDMNDNVPVFAEGTVATVSYAENDTTAVTTVIATDADAGQTVTFSLSGGSDESKFSITSAGVLTFNMAPDYEMPTDMGTNNEYEVTITATDGETPPMTAMQTLTITVTNEEDEGVTGLEAFTDISVYPNPAGAVLHISGVAENARYTLSGKDGKVLKRGKLKATGTADHSVAIPSLKQGIYLLQLTTGKGSITRKIVKE